MRRYRTGAAMRLRLSTSDPVGDRPHRRRHGIGDVPDLTVAGVGERGRSTWSSLPPRRSRRPASARPRHGFDVRLATFSHQRCRPVLADSGPLIVRARTNHVGRHQIHAEVSVEDTLARPVLFGSGSALQLQLDPPPPPPTVEAIEVHEYRTPDPHARPAPGYSGFTPEVFIRRSGLDVMQEVLEDDSSPILDFLGGGLTNIAFGRCQIGRSTRHPGSRSKFRRSPGACLRPCSTRHAGAPGPRSPSPARSSASSARAPRSFEPSVSTPAP